MIMRVLFALVLISCTVVNSRSLIEKEKELFDEVDKFLEEYERSLKLEKKGIINTLPESNLDTCGLVTNAGFPYCETHQVTTEDGYILTLHRIPNNTGKPVIIQHGLLGSSTHWVENLRNQSLGFILADAGYDVWLGNARGNTYSKRHRTLDVSSKAFWDFTWQEMGQYDLPTMINFVYNKRKQKVYYMGHSQGTLMAFTEFSRNPALSAKVKKFFALAPVSLLGHVTSPLAKIAPYAKYVSYLFNLIGVRQFLPSNWIMQLLGSKVCATIGISAVCKNVVFLIAGSNAEHMNQTRLPLYLSNTPAGTSTKNLVHFAQLINSKKCQMYDYGKSTNQKKYGQDTPPVYDMRNVNVPVVAYWGTKDALATPTDVALLLEKLPKLEASVLVPTYDHLDFIWAITADKYLYNDIVKRLNADS